jgi:3-phenylpropionate/trans-cinnamate dioxygenase ferredoxin component
MGAFPERPRTSRSLVRVALSQKGNNMEEVIMAGASIVLSDGHIEALEIAGVKIAVANVGGAIYAFDNTCTHRQCPLDNGELEGTTITCPCHGSQFDVASGAVLTGPAKDPIATYPVRVEDNAIEIGI